MALGDRLKFIREQKGLSQNELSRRSGVRQALISELESGKKEDTTGHALRSMARVLGVSVDYLLATFEPGKEAEPAMPALVEA